MKSLYKFNVDCGRMGELSGLFIAEDKDVQEMIGKEIYFGEVLGKHSDISLIIEDQCLAKINISQDAIEEIESVTGKDICGHNPFNYLEE